MEPQQRIDELTARVELLEQRMAQAFAQLGVAPVQAGTSVSPDVRTLALSGDKIQAIKLYREQTGVGLAEAKAAVDGIDPTGLQIR